ncbi:MAG: putative zinc-binding protein [Myxococcota bacterium]|nr:putative zinc-binding protein [Myxococcota bacterium]
MSVTDSSSCCACSGPTALVFPCSGSSNVGQLANALGLYLSQEGIAKMSCLAGVGAHLGGFVASARDCERLIVIDGCPLRCAAKLFEHVAIEPKHYILLTEHGFRKQAGVLPSADELERAKTFVNDLLQEH